MSLKNIYKI